MESVRTRAFKLRLAGQSYNEIHQALDVPKSTLSGWFKNVVLSEKAKVRLASRSKIGSAVFVKLNKAQTHHAEQRARSEQGRGAAMMNKLTRKDLVLIGVALYWAEGYKRLKVRDGKTRMNHSISFVNSDPEMIRAFTHFLVSILKIPPETIRLNMRLYAHINESSAREYWRLATGLPNGRFFKTTYLISGASKGVRPFNRLPWGTLQVEVCDTSKFHYLLGMIEGVKKQLGHDKVHTRLDSSASRASS